MSLSPNAYLQNAMRGPPPPIAFFDYARDGILSLADGPWPGDETQRHGSRGSAPRFTEEPVRPDATPPTFLHASHICTHSPCCMAHWTYTPKNQTALHVPLAPVITTPRHLAQFLPLCRRSGDAARLHWSREVVLKWSRAPRRFHSAGQGTGVVQKSVRDSRAVPVRHERRRAEWEESVEGYQTREERADESSERHRRPVLLSGRGRRIATGLFQTTGEGTTASGGAPGQKCRCTCRDAKSGTCESERTENR